MANRNILQDMLDIYDHLVHFAFIWYIFPGLHQKNLATLLCTFALEKPRCLPKRIALALSANNRGQMGVG
jgi:hypothetical protein